MLALDLDPGRAGEDVDDITVEHRHERGTGRAAEAPAQAEALAEIVSRRSQVLADSAPSGDRHVYVLFAARRPSSRGALDRSGGPLGLAPGESVMISRPGWLMPGLRWIVADPPLLSTMRHGTGRLRNVAPGYEPARRLTFGYRAGEDAERPLPSVHLELHKALETPEAWHEARPSNENHILAGSDPLLWLAPLDGSEPKPRKAQHPWPP